MLRPTPESRRLDPQAHASDQACGRGWGAGSFQGRARADARPAIAVSAVLKEECRDAC